jgi:hypothetical protein
MRPREWIISHRCSWITVYVFCCNAQSESHSDPHAYVCYLYSINCLAVLCLPSMLLFILWRDTTSELWTPVQFLLHCYYRFTFTRIIYILANYYLLPLNTLNPLFTANRWDWQPHHKLGQNTWLCCVQVPCCCWWKVTRWQAFFWCHYPECRKASGHQPSEVWFFLLLVW